MEPEASRTGRKPKRMSAARLARLEALRDLFASGGWHTVEALAVRFGVSTATINRDLLALQGEPYYEPLTSAQVWHAELTDVDRERLGWLLDRTLTKGEHGQEKDQTPQP